MSNLIYANNKYLSNSMIPYENIVAFGENTSVLHYAPSNLVRANDGDLVLIDAGARINGYCSDLTRTFPLNGKFTEK